MVSCQKGPTRHAYAWQIGPFWQDTLDLFSALWGVVSRGKSIWSKAWRISFNSMILVTLFKYLHVDLPETVFETCNISNREIYESNIVVGKQLIYIPRPTLRSTLLRMILYGWDVSVYFVCNVRLVDRQVWI